MASLGSTAGPLAIGAAAVAVADTDSVTGGRLPLPVRAGIVLVFCAVALEWCVAYWGATCLRDVVGLPRSTAVAGMACFFGAMLVGRTPAGLLATRPGAPAAVRSGVLRPRNGRAGAAPACR